MSASFTVSVELSGVGAGWTDITRDVGAATMRVKRGFQSAYPDDLVAQPGTWTFQLNNGTDNSGGVVGYYSPDSSHVRSGFALGIRARLQITANGTTRTVFLGWVEEIDPAPGVYDGQTVQVLVVTWLGMAATCGVSGLTAAAGQRGDQLLTSLVAQVPFSPAATSFATGVDTYAYAFDDLDPASSSVMDGIDSVARSGFDRIFEKADGTLVFESRQFREAPTPAVAAYTDVVGGGTPGLAIIRGAGMVARRRRSATLTRFQVTVHPKRVDASPVFLYTMPLDSYPYVEAGQTIVITAPYTDPVNPSVQVAGVNMQVDDGAGNLIVASSGPLHYVNFSTVRPIPGGPLGMGLTLTATVVYGATQATITITNGTTHRAYIWQLQCSGQGVYAYYPVTGQATNATQQAISGQNVRAVDCPYQDSVTFASAAASWCAQVFGAQLAQLDGGVSFFVHANDEVSLDGLLAREISDPVSITETVTGLSAAMQWINSVTLQIDERCNVTVTFGVQQMVSGMAWVLGVAGSSELGVTTEVATF